MVKHSNGIVHRSRDKIERQYKDEDGYWIELRRGWVVPGDAHSIVENTKREAYAKLRDVVRCQCKECQG